MLILLIFSFFFFSSFSCPATSKRLPAQTLIIKNSNLLSYCFFFFFFFSFALEVSGPMRPKKFFFFPPTRLFFVSLEIYFSCALFSDSARTCFCVLCLALFDLLVLPGSKCLFLSPVASPSGFKLSLCILFRSVA